MKLREVFDTPRIGQGSLVREPGKGGGLYMICQVGSHKMCAVTMERIFDNPPGNRFKNPVEIEAESVHSLLETDMLKILGNNWRDWTLEV